MMAPRTHVLAVCVSIALSAFSAPVHAQIVNGSFETGSFASWVTQDVSSPFFPLQVAGAGQNPGFGFFTSAPTNGRWAALHGFDGAGRSGGTNTISVAQDALIDAPILEFDYRAAWDMTFGATRDREFSVNIEPTGGGAPLQTTLLLTAAAGTTMMDTGPLTASIDVSGFVDGVHRVSFEWLVPEDFTGPGFFQLDNVRLTPEPGSLLLLGLGGLLLARRRRGG